MQMLLAYRVPYQSQPSLCLGVLPPEAWPILIWSSVCERQQLQLSAGCCRWSRMLTPGPAFLRGPVSKGIRHILWDNNRWLRQQQARAGNDDSDEDDTEQFGIREGLADDEGQADLGGDDEEEGEVLPFYSDDASDYGDSSCEVTGCFRENCLSCALQHGHLLIEDIHMTCSCIPLHPLLACSKRAKLTNMSSPARVL